MSLRASGDAQASALRHFTLYVQDHEMTVLLDQGIYRHLLFKSPKTSIAWFEIITTPNLLTVHGDLGTFSFSRVTDMFDFFRGSSINPGYWAEKVQSVDRHGDIREFSMVEANKWLDEVLEEFNVEDHVEEKYRESYDIDLADLREEAYDYHEFRESVEGFFASWMAPQEMLWDPPEPSSVEEYSHRFLLCLFSIVYAIEQYDQNKNRETS